MAREINPAFEALKQYLIENFGAVSASGGKEIVKRCHFCGDSRNLSSRHMYIGMKHGMIVYNCFKCNSHGVVDGKFMRDMEAFNPDLISLINQNNRSNESFQMNLSKTRFLKNQVPIFTYREAPETLKKLNYINSRLGTQFNLADMAKYKIVLNLYDYLNANGVTELSRDQQVTDALDMFFLGFLSVDNSFLIMRRLVPEGKLPKNVDFRYVNYNIYNLEGGYTRNYIIPATIDCLKPIELHIAEGAFDIIGAQNYFKRYDNCIFASVAGKSYLTMVKYFILEYGFINFSVHLYVDNDVEQWEIDKVANLLSIFKNPLYIHHNRFPGEKDYGVDCSRIQDEVIRMI